MGAESVKEHDAFGDHAVYDSLKPFGPNLRVSMSTSFGPVRAVISGPVWVRIFCLA